MFKHKWRQKKNWYIAGCLNRVWDGSQSDEAICMMFSSSFYAINTHHSCAMSLPILTDLKQKALIHQDLYNVIKIAHC